MKKIAGYSSEVEKGGVFVRVSILVEGTYEHGENSELMQRVSEEVRAHGDKITDSVLAFIGWHKGE